MCSSFTWALMCLKTDFLNSSEAIYTHLSVSYMLDKEEENFNIVYCWGRNGKFEYFRQTKMGAETCWLSILYLGCVLCHYTKSYLNFTSSALSIIFSETYSLSFSRLILISLCLGLYGFLWCCWYCFCKFWSSWCCGVPFPKNLTMIIILDNYAAGIILYVHLPNLTTS